jgi:hypothetical protein
MLKIPTHISVLRKKSSEVMCKSRRKISKWRAFYEVPAVKETRATKRVRLEQAVTSITKETDERGGRKKRKVGFALC